MHLTDTTLTLSPTDLASYFECGHKSVLDLSVALKQAKRPGQSEVQRELLEKRGHEHEQRVLEYYRERGKRIWQPSTTASSTGQSPADATLAAMREGYDVIYQATLAQEGWQGRPDFLLKVELPEGQSSLLGDYAYEPVDAKLARQEKARAVLQLCAYADLLQSAQGAAAAHIWLALGEEEITPRCLRASDYLAYYRATKASLASFLADVQAKQTEPPYPEPVPHCEVCEWWRQCESRRRDDDHLSLVAGLNRRQRSRLEAQKVARLEELAQLAEGTEVDGVSPEALAKLRHQAHLQLQERTSGTPSYELLTTTEAGKGLELLPEPCPGDLFLDIEGDAFVKGGGLEYLFGLVELGQPENDWVARTEPGPPRYLSFWATTREEEKRAFQAVIKRIFQGRTELKKMRVYHFGAREEQALKTLSCRHACCEEEVDTLLRERVLVDLHGVVRQGLRASVEAYTLKELERFHGFERQTELRAASRAMQYFGRWLELGDPSDASASSELAQLRATIAAYNEEDCLSTWNLRGWLEERRTELAGLLQRPLARPTEHKPEKAKEERDSTEAARVVERLIEGLPQDEAADTPEQSARRLLANLVGWHWRELKSGWWEYFEAEATPREEWKQSHLVLDGLEYKGEVGAVAKSLIHRYEFPKQEHGIKAHSKPIDAGPGGKAVDVQQVGPNYVELKRGKRSRARHPVALRPGRPVPMPNQEARLLEIAQSVASDGLDAVEPFGAARTLLARHYPRAGQAPGSDLMLPGEDPVDALSRLCLALDRSVLPVQGPPGSGKTFCAVRAILALVRAGKKVGVTANSHQVMLGLLQRLHAAAEKDGTAVPIHHMGEADRYPDYPFPVHREYAAIEKELASGALNVLGGTSYALCRPEFVGKLDVLFVDEAGQMSLANALAVSTAAKSLVLLGDPAQLEQPQKGVHPEGADVSALEHLAGAGTMPSDRGLFLPTTRRLHPQICDFVSSIFYEGRLSPLPALMHQAIVGAAHLSGSGLRYLPVRHSGNTSSSPEEAQAVAGLVEQLLNDNVQFVDDRGAERALTPADILIVTPYNAQVGQLRELLPEGVDIGTVDKFQGREAPVVIYSMCTSRGDEAPRGLEFLYSLNRLNVAVSRAQALVIVAASPELLKAPCQTPRHLQLVNALCAYVERAQVLACRRP